MELSRKQVIDNLIFIRDMMLGDTDENGTWRVALSYAIDSLKTDEMYQLDYEGVQNVVVTEGMTNGDVIKTLFPNKQFVSIASSRIYDFTTDNKIDCDLDWWNSSYKENK